ncbi:hypothetical protein [Bacillus sp. UMB0728]|uniref:hypothetical protein n=1 Tax=Bacillus sp. UMB0728 TaxID=2066052 RepID=UPI000C772DA9|nr:hypothetical protein [Bacillus sp. UMB0728]PLR70269.1 hypothetical protein CYJ37_24935 [Bacillus sp. UMB0728]
MKTKYSRPIIKIDWSGPEGNVYHVMWKAEAMLEYLEEFDKSEELNYRFQHDGLKSYEEVLDLVNEYVTIENMDAYYSLRAQLDGEENYDE